jgi:TRAP-type C4-dicarboxylate transport system permease small subunit
MTDHARTRVSRLDLTLGWISNALLCGAGVALLLIMVHTAADVAVKYFTDATVFATLEITSSYYMVATVFLALAHVQRRRKHIVVEVFTQRLSPAAVARLDSVTSLAAAVFMAVMTWAATLNAMANTRRWEVIEIIDVDLVVWPSRWFVPVGCAVMTVYLLVQTVTLWREATVDS